MDDDKVAVLLEDLMPKFRTFGEGLEGLRDEMNGRFDNLEQKLENHIIENRSEFLQNRLETSATDTDDLRVGYRSSTNKTSEMIQVTGLDFQ